MAYLEMKGPESEIIEKQLELREKELYPKEIFEKEIAPSLLKEIIEKKIVEIERLKEFSPERLGYDLNSLGEICSKIKFICEKSPPEKEIMYLLNFPDIEPEEKEHSKFIDLFNWTRGDFLSKDIQSYFQDEFELYLNNCFYEYKFVDKKILEELKQKNPFTRYLGVITGSYEMTEGNYQVVLNLIDTKNSSILDQVVFKIKPEEIEKLNKSSVFSELILQKTQEIIENLENQKEILKLPEIKIKQTSPLILIDGEKMERFSEKEREIYQTNPKYFKDLKLDFVVEDDNGNLIEINLSIPENLRKLPIKTKGKVRGIYVVTENQYRLFVNNEEIPITAQFSSQLEDEKDKSENAYYIGPSQFSMALFGTLSLFISPTNEVNLEVKDKNNQVVAKFSIEQTPEWLMDRFYYQNSKGEKDSILVYLTDIDTLKTYQKYDKTEIIKNLKNFMEGVIRVEKYFNIDLNCQKIRIGKADFPTAFYNPTYNLKNSINCVIEEVEGTIKRDVSEELKEKDLALTGSHEALHKLDFLLGGDDFLSWNSKKFSKFYRERIKEISSGEYTNIESLWLSLGKEKQKKSLFYYVTEGNFYSEIKDPSFGHPFDNEVEFFASLLNTAMTERNELKEKFLTWPEKIRKEYIEGLSIIKEMLKGKVDTKNLEETIEYLKEINKLKKE
jgi:hypothetical protein